MAAEYTIYISGIEADEPVTLELLSGKTLTIKNTGDETGTELGFYLQMASSNGPFEYPSTDSPAVNLNDILSQGNAGYGLTITQGVITTRFTSSVGNSYPSRIPLTVGEGSLGNQLAVNSSCTVELNLTFEPGSTAKSYYVDLILV